MNCFNANAENFVNFPDIFVFCEFLEDVEFFEGRNTIFGEGSLKAFCRRGFGVFGFSKLSNNSRYFESVTLKSRENSIRLEQAYIKIITRP